MYITNSPRQARQALEAGANRIFVDLETIGKQERQAGLDTVKSEHSIADIARVRQELPDAELLVRINPMGPHTQFEVDASVSAGADILMLPMFSTPEEVEAFVNFVGGRARTNLLLETPQALIRLPEFLRLAPDIDEIHVGLNDLHLAMRLDFMFEIVAGGMLDSAARQIREQGIRFGFGGIARVGSGDVPAEQILIEHVRLRSELVILSRGFHRGLTSATHGDASFAGEIAKLRAWEQRWRKLSMADLHAKSEKLRQRIFTFARNRRCSSADNT